MKLNDPRVLAEHGLAQSESNPQFHEQMVHAVATTIIGHFKQVLRIPFMGPIGSAVPIPVIENNYQFAQLELSPLE